MGSVNSLETLGLVDGPGIRFVIFLNSCNLRCIFCHNPEMWNMQKDNCSIQEIVNKVLRYKTYFGKNGGVTFSGGEPLLQPDFIIEVCKLLKKENISVAIDTAGIGTIKDEEVLDYVDYVLLDIKHVNRKGYLQVTRKDYFDKFNNFIELLNRKNKKVWIRQVIIPNINDNKEYLHELKEYLKKIKNIERIDFLPYHKMGDKKYESLGINNPLANEKEMDIDKCKKLYEEFLEI